MKNAADIKAASVLISLLFSVWAISQDNVINDDGIRYLLSAQLISQGDWQGAFSIYNWLFYPAVIAFLDTVSGLGLENAAHAINAMLQAVIVYAFISLVAAAGADRRTLFAAALVILVYPNFNEYRSDILRDPGYWAFYLLGALQLSRYASRPSAHAAWAFATLMFMAFLFRVEALLVYLMAPLLMLVFRPSGDGRRWPALAKLFTPLGVAMLVLAAAWLLFSEQLFALLGGMGKPLELVDWFVEAVLGGLAQKAEILREQYLIKYSLEYAWHIVIASLLIILVFEIAKAVGVVFAGLLAYAVYKQRIFPNRELLPAWWALIITNLVILALFVVSQGFLVGRYSVALTLMLMVGAAFGLVALYDQWRSSTRPAWQRRAGATIALLVLLFAAVDGLHSSGASKAYIREAGNWLKENTRDDERIFCREQSLLYMAGRLTRDDYLRIRRDNLDDNPLLKKKRTADALMTEDWRGHDYAVFLVSRKAPNFESDANGIIGSKPAQVFSNTRGDRAIIYRINTAQRGPRERAKMTTVTEAVRAR